MGCVRSPASDSDKLASYAGRFTKCSAKQSSVRRSRDRLGRGRRHDGAGADARWASASPFSKRDRMLNPARDYKEHKWPSDYEHRGALEGGMYSESKYEPFSFFSAPNGYWNIEGEPYTVAEGSEFRWFRSRILGGRTNHYGRISLRFADYDFKPYTRDGLGTDWPITYEDVAPYYDKAEAFIGVTGTKGGIRSAPDGVFQPPPAPRVHEVLIQKAGQKLGIPVIPARMAIITKTDERPAACHYCGQCGRGCVTASNYSSSQVQIMPAMKTGKLKIFPNAMARELITDGAGKVKAVSYIDKATRTESRSAAERWCLRRARANRRGCC